MERVVLKNLHFAERKLRRAEIKLRKALRHERNVERKLDEAESQLATLVIKEAEHRARIAFDFIEERIYQLERDQLIQVRKTLVPPHAGVKMPDVCDQCVDMIDKELARREKKEPRAAKPQQPQPDLPAQLPPKKNTTAPQPRLAAEEERLRELCRTGGFTDIFEMD